MIDGMENYVGKKLKESFVQMKQPGRNGEYYIITRPHFYSDAIHINMYIHFEKEKM